MRNQPPPPLTDCMHRAFRLSFFFVHRPTRQRRRNDQQSSADLEPGETLDEKRDVEGGNFRDSLVISETYLTIASAVRRVKMVGKMRAILLSLAPACHAFRAVLPLSAPACASVPSRSCCPMLYELPLDVAPQGTLQLQFEVVQQIAGLAWQQYDHALQSEPLQTKMLTAAFAAAVGDAIAQRSTSTSTAFAYNLPRGMAFMAFGAMYSGAFQHYFFDWLTLEFAVDGPI